VEEGGPPVALAIANGEKKAPEEKEEEDNLEGGMGLFDEDAEGGTWEVPQETPEQRLERLLRLQPPAPSRKPVKKERGSSLRYRQRHCKSLTLMSYYYKAGLGCMHKCKIWKSVQ
jgi:hypothetical protein